jgi:predicted lipoprotein with Yx(FWY)xxD motif
MKNLLISAGALAAALSLVVGAASAATSSSGAAKISIASTGIGPVLVNGRGRTLYLFGKDTRGKSTCSGACAGFWPPLIANGKPLAGAGVKAALIGTTKRADGRLQVTYDHHPLYTFVKDTQKGDTNGEGLNVFGAEWDAVSSTGLKVASTNAGTSGSGYGNGY